VIVIYKYAYFLYLFLFTFSAVVRYKLSRIRSWRFLLRNSTQFCAS